MSTTVDLIDLTKTYPGSDEPSVDEVNLSVTQGSMMALLGPSGCGKTTTLKMIAGLLDPTGGDIRFEGRSIVGVPAERRSVAMVFQKPLLFPHMTIGDNVAFGLRMKGLNRRSIAKRVAEYLDVVHLPGMEPRRPGQLSGGQEQRVSLARALITEPDVLLLDEPLSQLDANLRIEMRDLIRGVQQELGVTAIFVTHDQEEAVMLADRIALMLDGKVLQDDAPQAFYERPQTLEVARFFGCQNFLPGRAAGRTFETEVGSFSLPNGSAPQGPGVLTIRQEAIRVGAAGANAVIGTVEKVMYLGTHTRVWTRARGHQIQFVDDPSRRYEIGSTVELCLPAEHLWIVPSEGVSD
jgi:ABC-type Fe3+/spermidine/putrescine transport system ATPase subunit